VDEPASDDDGELFAAAYPGLRRFAAVVAPLDLDPDDLVQEAVTRALRIGPLHALDHPTAYLRRTMVNVAANHNRTKGRERRAHVRIAGAATDEPGASYPSDLAELDRLDPSDRAALYLADVERLPLAEVADALGTNAPAARARVSRARRRLRQALTEGDPS
jgi:RNA polymerase sigma-70 factor (ECF subfamily)